MATQPSTSNLVTATRAVGCVSYLNAKPLIDRLDDEAGLRVRLDVPSRLLVDLESGDVDIALCPVIDYHRSRVPLQIVPVGGIACEGPTLTVRVFSRVPIDDIATVYADTDSHTSVSLLRVLLRDRLGRDVELIDYDAREHTAAGRIVDQPDTVLLIGDKVVTDAPNDSSYSYELDLGEAWNTMTDLPFVFAVWMARADMDLGNLPEKLAACRARNVFDIDSVVERYHVSHGWPRDLAKRYFSEILRFTVGPRELESIDRFSELACSAGVVGQRRDLVIYPAVDAQ